MNNSGWPERRSVRKKISMKIAYVQPVYWPAVGGCEIYTHELVLRLSSQHDLRVITQINSQRTKLRAEEKSPFFEYLWFAATAFAPLHGPWSYEEDGARVHVLRVNRFSRKWLYPLVRYHHRMPDFSFNLLKAYFSRKMERRLKKTELIHCIHGGVSFLGHAAYDMARLKGLPFVYTPVLHLINQDWIADYRSATQRGEPFTRLPSLVMTPRGWHDPYWLDLCRKADALISLTEFEKEYFVREGVSPERIFPIGVGPILSEDHDAKRFRERHELGGQPVVLFLGRNHPLKGIVALREAAPLVWERHPDAVFLFVGPLEGEARSYFEKKDDPRVRVLGSVTQEEKTSALAACDLLCLPSLNESFGIVFLEAWSFGKPVIGGDIPPVRELVTDGKGGFLVMPEPRLIAERVCTLLEDRELSRRMGEWGREKILKEYTWERIAEKMENVYSQLKKEDLPLNPVRFEDRIA